MRAENFNNNKELICLHLICEEFAEYAKNISLQFVTYFQNKEYSYFTILWLLLKGLYN